MTACILRDSSRYESFYRRRNRSELSKRLPTDCLPNEASELGNLGPNLKETMICGEKADIRIQDRPGLVGARPN